MDLSTLFLLLAACPAGSPDTQPADTDTGEQPEQCPPADSGAVEDCVPQGDTEVCGNGIDDDCDGSANECGWSGVFSIDEVAHIIAAESEQDLAGSAVGAAGDVDCDGFDDFLIGADHAGDMPLGPGAAYVMRGGTEIGDNLGQAWATLRGTEDRADFGNRRQGIGDVDCDGRGDIAVAGLRIYVFLDLQPGESSDTTASAVFTGAAPFSTYTSYFSGGADLTGDGPSDLFLWVGGRETDYGDYFSATFVCDAAMVGEVDTNQCGARIDDPDGTVGLVEHQGTGDFDGDGQADLLVIAPSDCPDCAEGEWDWNGAAMGMYGPITGDRSWDDPDFKWTGERGDQAGYAAAVLGDTNADGYDDIAVSTIALPNAVHVATGPFSGTRSLWDADALLLDVYWQCLGGTDVDGDGKADLIVKSAYSGELGGPAAGLHHGPFTGTVDAANLVATFVATVAAETETQAGFNGNCAAAGDVNADGHGDLLFGDRYAGLDWTASGASVDQNDGQTYLLLGNGQ